MRRGSARNHTVARLAPPEVVQRPHPLLVADRRHHRQSRAAPRPEESGRGRSARTRRPAGALRPHAPCRRSREKPDGAGARKPRRWAPHRAGTPPRSRTRTTEPRRPTCTSAREASHATGGDERQRVAHVRGLLQQQVKEGVRPEGHGQQQRARAARRGPPPAAQRGQRPTTAATPFDDQGRTKLSVSAIAMRRGVGFAHSMSTHAKSSPACDPSAAR